MNLLILFASILQLVITKLNAMKGHAEFWGSPMVLYCTICNIKYAQLHFVTPRLPMQLIFMKLIGFFDSSTNGYHYAVTVISMWTGYTFCLCLKTMAAAEVFQAYVDKVLAKSGGYSKILLDRNRVKKPVIYANHLPIRSGT